MQRWIMALAVALAGTTLAAPSANAVCNVRGQYCDYPAWAANAFSHPRDRVPNWVLIDQDRLMNGDAYRYRAHRAHRGYNGKSKRWR